MNLSKKKSLCILKDKFNSLSPKSLSPILEEDNGRRIDKKFTKRQEPKAYGYSPGVFSSKSIKLNMKP